MLRYKEKPMTDLTSLSSIVIPFAGSQVDQRAKRKKRACKENLDLTHPEIPSAPR